MTPQDIDDLRRMARALRNEAERLVAKLEFAGDDWPSATAAPACQTRRLGEGAPGECKDCG